MAGSDDFILVEDDDEILPSEEPLPEATSTVDKIGLSAVSYTHLTLPTSDLV